MDLARELQKLEYESYGDANCSWCPCYSHQRIDKWTGGLVYKRMSRDHPNNSIVEIRQNIEKSPEDFRRLVVNHTRLTLVGKTQKGVIILIENIWRMQAEKSSSGQIFCIIEKTSFQKILKMNYVIILECAIIKQVTSPH